ncbi:MAG: cyclase family protein, partial [Gammaproteobacteria bacterium]|nr:cyclase family protein [Gemmatimonadota bacterium]NIU76971.1 cyclase family protein [Gammaproteobacteria bacterium]NIV88650.1 cyclase family protein [Actinomycetota bacterium]NIX22705.1 cyclase family protein [Actinomycetota bacterium]
VPLESLIGPAVVLDITEKTRDDRDYRLAPDDVLAWEAEHGRIPEGSIVLLRTGWDRFWPDARTYLGTAERGEVAAENLHFPSYGVEAAR